MQEIIGACGNDCTSCPWSYYVRQTMQKEDWEEYAANVKKHLGFKPTMYEWEGCRGCTVVDEEMPDHPHYNFLRGCRTRKCVRESKMSTCAQCSYFLCEDGVVDDNYSWKKIKARQPDITKEDYMNYISQFDGLTTLKVLRSLHEGDIKKPIEIQNEDISKPFPQTFDISKEEFQDLYHMLHHIKTSDKLVQYQSTIAGNELKAKRLDTIFRLLWIGGLKGELIDTETIKIDSISLHDLRKTTKFPHHVKGWNEFFDILAKLDLLPELKIQSDDIFTPMGWMREMIPGTSDPAYYIELQTTNDIQGRDFFLLLKDYSTSLNNLYRRGAFNQFSQLNMAKIVQKAV